MPNHGSSSSERRHLRRLLALLLILPLLAGCPPAVKGPKPYTGTDALRVTRYDYAGMHVAQVHDQRPFVHLQVVIPRGTADIRGLEDLILDAALSAGAGPHSPTAYRAAQEAAGVHIDRVSHEDYVALRMRSLPAHLEQGFKLMSLALTAPRLEPATLHARINTHKAEARQRATTIPAQADALLRQAAFEGTPAQQPSLPDEATLAGLDPAYLRSIAQDKLLQRCRIAIIVTGPVDAERIADLLFDTLDQLPEGECTPPAPASPTFGRIALSHHTEPLQAISAVFPAPHPDAPEAFAYAAAADILAAKLRDRLIDQLRLAISLDLRYVSASPACMRLDLAGPRMLQAAELALSEIRLLRDAGITTTALDSAKTWMLAERQMRMESADAWAREAAHAQVNGGWANFGNPLERTQALQPAHIQQALQAHIHAVTWAFVGDTTRIDRKSLFRL